ncbi:MAG TPA: xanthine dehydrogenase family protein subunit M [Acidimicrobiia bacterium]|nr:xanthine dehydrogenase family protein subunit M [Acidimicrobiia bacterium]
MRFVDYLAPTNLDSALSAFAGGKWTVLAGGTDFYPARVGHPLTEPVLDISGLDELRGISVTDDAYRIGALTRWADIKAADLPPAFDGLRLAAAEVGGIQVQNAGTIAGNLCNASPAADGIPPLLTLDASVELASQGGQRVVPLSAFLTGYRQIDLQSGELVTAVIVPRQVEEAFSDFQKLGSRSYLVISIVMVATVIAADPEGIISDARIAVGACSPVALRLTELESELRGKHRNDRALQHLPTRHHLDRLAPIDDVRATADYRFGATLTLIRRSLRRFAESA